ncbi:MAG: RidA family protein [Acholeplasmatales bacterium]|nr:RidA family protein [Acholeplasmatales bacterium]
MKVISTDKAPKAIGPYSQAIEANGFIYASGQIPVNPATGSIDGKTIEEQAHQCFKNISEVLKAAGSGFDKVIKATVFVKDIKDFAVINEIYATYFISKPARSLVEVSNLPKGALIETEVIAIK